MPSQLLQKLDDESKIALKLDECGQCGNIIELFKSPISGDSVTYESLLYDIINTPDLKVKFEEFVVMCPRCKEKTEGSTYFKMDKKELELLNSTPLKDILITV